MQDVDGDSAASVGNRDSRSEDMFLAWCLGLPLSTDVAEAARIEIARLDEVGADSAATMRLRNLLVQASKSGFASPRGLRRSRH